VYRLFWFGLVGCGRIAIDPIDAGDRDSAAPPCTEPWSAPFLIELGQPFMSQPSIRGDGLELYASAGNQLYVAKRASKSEPFGPALVVPSPPSTGLIADSDPSISDDGLELFYTWYTMGNAFNQHALRGSVTEPFGPHSTVAISGQVDISGDRLTLYSTDLGTEIRRQRRPTIDEPFGAITPASYLPAPVNDGVSISGGVSISSDDLDLYFMSTRSGMVELWVAHRSSPSEEFSTVEVIPLPNFRSSPDISSDGHVLYYEGADNRIWAISRCE
jgi:hypothetical protein